MVLLIVKEQNETLNAALYNMSFMTEKVDFWIIHLGTVISITFRLEAAIFTVCIPSLYAVAGGRLI